MTTLARTAFTTILLSAGLLSTAACGDSAEARDARREAGEALNAAKNYTTKEIEDMTTQLKERWSDLQTEITKLKAEADAKGARAKADLQKVIADVEAKAKDAKTKLGEVAGAGKEQAGESLSHLEKAYESAKTSVQEAWRELRK